METFKAHIITLIAFTFILISLPLHAAPDPHPQYRTTDDTAGRTYTGYFIEDGKLKNTLIVVKLRRLRSYWDGTSWVNYAARVEKNDLSKTITDNDSDNLKYLAKFPNYVTIGDNRVFFDPEEN